jgi:adenylate cyclase
MQPRTILRIRSVAAVTVVAAALGAAISISPDRAVGAAIGGLSGLTLSSLEITLQGEAGAVLRRYPLLPVLALRTVLYGAVFVLATRAGAWLVAALGGAVPPDAGEVTRASLLQSVGLSLAFNIFFVVRGLLGPRTLMLLLVSRYRRPREERRIVLFLDVQGSTRIAERIGNAAFHGFLNRVFSDVTDPILATGGEIYRYVGDEIIVTWPFARGIRDGACIACLFAIEDVLARRQAEYERAFGAVPRLRAALHAGPLIVGEMGDVKREIVLLGDVMNTASRIEQACRSTGHDAIASGAVLEGLALPPGIVAHSLGPVALRGKAEPIELFALTRATEGRAA